MADYNYYRSQHTGEIIDAMIADHMRMHAEGLSHEDLAENAANLENSPEIAEAINDAVHASAVKESEELTVGGVTLRIITKEVFDRMESFDPDVLYVVVR